MSSLAELWKSSGPALEADNRMLLLVIMSCTLGLRELCCREICVEGSVTVEGLSSSFQET